MSNLDSKFDDDFENQFVEEGKIRLRIPIKKEKDIEKEDILDKNAVPTKSMPVFYNKKMILNRDLTILMVKVYSKLLGREVSFLDTMCASGVRTLRLLKETNKISKIFFNDLNPLAIKYTLDNLKLNSIDEKKYQSFAEDSKQLLNRFRYIKQEGKDEDANFCDVIDIDPFGTPSQYIPAAMQAIEIGGLLCVTATDTPVLFGIRKEVCIRKYLTKPIKPEFLKEMGMRILIYYIAKIAHIYELSITPVLSLSSDHFVRTYIVVNRGIQSINENIKHFGRYFYCDSCGNRGVEYDNIKGFDDSIQICPICNSSLRRSGLLWLGKLQSEEYISELENLFHNPDNFYLKSLKKLKKYISAIKNEDKFPPYYFTIPKIADRLNISFPSLEKILNAIKERGFRGIRTHYDPVSIKTDANITQIKVILQEMKEKQ